MEARRGEVPARRGKSRTGRGPRDPRPGGPRPREARSWPATPTRDSDAPLVGWAVRGGSSARQSSGCSDVNYGYELLIEIENVEYVVDYRTGDILNPETGEVIGRVIY